MSPMEVPGKMEAQEDQRDDDCEETKLEVYLGVDLFQPAGVYKDVAYISIIRDGQRVDITMNAAWELITST